MLVYKTCWAGTTLGMQRFPLLVWFAGMAWLEVRAVTLHGPSTFWITPPEPAPPLFKVL